MEEKQLLIAAVKPRCRVLGPGERFVIWVQGCPFSCPGCVAESMRSFDAGKVVSVAELEAAILRTEGIEGITVSGGEPFLQAEELADLFGRIRRQKDLGIIVYTGFYYERLKGLASEHGEIAEMLSHIDLLIDGPYEEQNNLNYGLKGSVNQRALAFTERYQNDLHLYNDAGSVRKSELYQDEAGTFMAGVPSKDMEQKWKALKARTGGRKEV